MTPDVVVDVGNTRVKWGRCQGGAVVASASLPHDDLAAWQAEFNSWQLGPSSRWVITGVHPRTRDHLAQWITHQQGTTFVLASALQLPLHVMVDQPDRVGIDRLLNAVAANHRRLAGTPAVLVDAGSAVTVDYLDTSGAFRGGAIFPGCRLMAQALHQYTALLPLVEMSNPSPSFPGTSTPAAIEVGILGAVAGGIEKLIRRYRSLADLPPRVFLTGGDARLLGPALATEITLWPLMTLEGIRLAAETLS